MCVFVCVCIFVCAFVCVCISACVYLCVYVLEERGVGGEGTEREFSYAEKINAIQLLICLLLQTLTCGTARLRAFTTY